MEGNRREGGMGENSSTLWYILGSIALNRKGFALIGERGRGCRRKRRE